MVTTVQPTAGGKIRVIVAKAGLDGHDRGAKVFTPGAPTTDIVTWVNEELGTANASRG
jgi:methylmalonyl-CoA mutase cobalamin-binding subunit